MTCEKTIRDVLDEVFDSLKDERMQEKYENGHHPFEVIETDQKDKDLADFFREQGLL